MFETPGTTPAGMPVTNDWFDDLVDDIEFEGEDVKDVKREESQGVVQGNTEYVERRIMSSEKVFQILEMAHRGYFDESLPQRPQASPICPSVSSFYVNPSLKHLLSDSEREESLGSPESLIAVKYQGFANSELWWAPEHGNCKGFVARNMTRKARSSRSSGEHGFTGRWYTLVVRESPSVVVDKYNCKDFIPKGSTSFVQFWTVTEADNRHRRSKRRRASEPECTSDRDTYPASPCNSSPSPRSATDQSSRYSTASTKSHESEYYYKHDSPNQKEHRMHLHDSSQENQDSASYSSSSSYLNGSYSSGSSLSFPNAHMIGREGPRVIENGLVVKGDCVIEGNLVASNIRVIGQLTVDGGIHGRFVTPPNAADYAEWFPCLDKSEDIRPGDVVQLRSPDQRLTLDTSGKGPIMVVSTTPSVAAGVPIGVKKADGRLVAFLGQVPVRCKGPISCGDQLFPSGKNDGLAMTGDSRHADFEPIATAMESCGPGVHSVNAFVRWPHNRDWTVRRYRTIELSKTATSSWRMLLFFFIYLLVRSTWFPYSHLFHDVQRFVTGFEIAHIIYLFSRFPVYPEFARRDFWVSAACQVIDLVCTLAMLAEMVLMGGGVSESEPVSMIQIRKFVLDCMLAQFHLAVVCIVFRMYCRVRQAILRLPEENTERSDWRKIFDKTIFPIFTARS